MTKQNKGERNFHIFYQLLKGGSDEELEKLHLDRDLTKYPFLQQVRRQVLQLVFWFFTSFKLNIGVLEKNKRKTNFFKPYNAKLTLKKCFTSVCGL